MSIGKKRRRQRRITGWRMFDEFLNFVRTGRTGEEKIRFAFHSFRSNRRVERQQTRIDSQNVERWFDEIRLSMIRLSDGRFDRGRRRCDGRWRR